VVRTAYSFLAALLRTVVRFFAFFFAAIYSFHRPDQQLTLGTQEARTCPLMCPSSQVSSTLQDCSSK
jgi:hypothetical protein